MIKNVEVDESKTVFSVPNQFGSESCELHDYSRYNHIIAVEPPDASLISQDHKKFGDGSLYIGDYTHYILVGWEKNLLSNDPNSINDSGWPYLLNDDFTIEFWMKLDIAPDYKYQSDTFSGIAKLGIMDAPFIKIWYDVATNGVHAALPSGSGATFDGEKNFTTAIQYPSIFCKMDTFANPCNQTGQVSYANWAHVAVVFHRINSDTGTLNIFNNGVKFSENLHCEDIDNASWISEGVYPEVFLPITIGQASYEDSMPIGEVGAYFDEVKISVGSTYTENFTPSDKEFSLDSTPIEGYQVSSPNTVSITNINSSAIVKHDSEYPPGKTYNPGGHHVACLVPPCPGNINATPALYGKVWEFGDYKDWLDLWYNSPELVDDNDHIKRDIHGIEILCPAFGSQLLSTIEDTLDEESFEHVDRPIKGQIARDHSILKTHGALVGEGSVYEPISYIRFRWWCPHDFQERATGPKSIRLLELWSSVFQGESAQEHGWQDEPSLYVDVEVPKLGGNSVPSSETGKRAENDPRFDSPSLTGMRVTLGGQVEPSVWNYQGTEGFFSDQGASINMMIKPGAWNDFSLRFHRRPVSQSGRLERKPDYTVTLLLNDQTTMYPDGEGMHPNVSRSKGLGGSDSGTGTLTLQAPVWQDIQGLGICRSAPGKVDIIDVMSYFITPDKKDFYKRRRYPILYPPKGGVLLPAPPGGENAIVDSSDSAHSIVAQHNYTEEFKGDDKTTDPYWNKVPPPPPPELAGEGARHSNEKHKIGRSSIKFEGCPWSPWSTGCYEGSFLSVNSGRNDWDFRSQNFVIEFWINTNARTGTERVFGMGHDATAENPTWGSLDIFVSSRQEARSVGVNFTINTSAWTYGGIQVDARDAISNYALYSDKNVTDDQWHHIAVQRNLNVMTLYIDGEVATLDGEPSVLTFAPYANAPGFDIPDIRYDSFDFSGGDVTIGVWRYRRTDWFNGFLDEIRISDTARYTENFNHEELGRFKEDASTKLLIHSDVEVGGDSGPKYGLLEMPNNKCYERCGEQGDDCTRDHRGGDDDQVSTEGFDQCCLPPVYEDKTKLLLHFGGCASNFCSVLDLYVCNSDLRERSVDIQLINQDAGGDGEPIIKDAYLISKNSFQLSKNRLVLHEGEGISIAPDYYAGLKKYNSEGDKFIYSGSFDSSQELDTKLDLVIKNDTAIPITRNFYIYDITDGNENLLDQKQFTAPPGLTIEEHFEMRESLTQKKDIRWEYDDYKEISSLTIKGDNTKENAPYFREGGFEHEQDQLDYPQNRTASFGYDNSTPISATVVYKCNSDLPPTVPTPDPTPTPDPEELGFCCHFDGDFWNTIPWISKRKCSEMVVDGWQVTDTPYYWATAKDRWNYNVSPCAAEVIKPTLQPTSPPHTPEPTPPHTPAPPGEVYYYSVCPCQLPYTNEWLGGDCTPGKTYVRYDNGQEQDRKIHMLYVSTDQRVTIGKYTDIGGHCYKILAEHDGDDIDPFDHGYNNHEGKPIKDSITTIVGSAEFDSCSACGSQSTPQPTPITTCFLAGTKISMAGGREDTAIEVLKKGDVIKAYDEKNSKIVNALVARMHMHEDVSEYYVINGKLKITGEHPLFVRNKGWQNVEDLENGDELFLIKQNWKKITNIQRVEKMVTVYDIDASIYDTFFADGFLAHNKTPVPTRRGTCCCDQTCHDNVTQEECAAKLALPPPPSGPRPNINQHYLNTPAAGNCAFYEGMSCSQINCGSITIQPTKTPSPTEKTGKCCLENGNPEWKDVMNPHYFPDCKETTEWNCNSVGSNKIRFWKENEKCEIDELECERTNSGPYRINASLTSREDGVKGTLLASVGDSTALLEPVQYLSKEEAASVDPANYYYCSNFPSKLPFCGQCSDHEGFASSFKTCHGTKGSNKKNICISNEDFYTEGINGLWVRQDDVCEGKPHWRRESDDGTLYIFWNPDVGAFGPAWQMSSAPCDTSLASTWLTASTTGGNFPWDVAWSNTGNSGNLNLCAAETCPCSVDPPGGEGRCKEHEDCPNGQCCNDEGICITAGDCDNVTLPKACEKHEDCPDCHSCIDEVCAKIIGCGETAPPKPGTCEFVTYELTGCSDESHLTYWVMDHNSILGGGGVVGEVVEFYDADGHKTCGTIKSTKIEFLPCMETLMPGKTQSTIISLVTGGCAQCSDGGTTTVGGRWLCLGCDTNTGNIINKSFDNKEECIDCADASGNEAGIEVDCIYEAPGTSFDFICNKTEKEEPGGPTLGQKKCIEVVGIGCMTHYWGPNCGPNGQGAWVSDPHSCVKCGNQTNGENCRRCTSNCADPIEPSGPYPDPTNKCKYNAPSFIIAKGAGPWGESSRAGYNCQCGETPCLYGNGQWAWNLFGLGSLTSDLKEDGSGEWTLIVNGWVTCMGPEYTDTQTKNAEQSSLTFNIGEGIIEILFSCSDPQESSQYVATANRYEGQCSDCQTFINRNGFDSKGQRRMLSLGSLCGNAIEKIVVDLNRDYRGEANRIAELAQQRIAEGKPVEPERTNLQNENEARLRERMINEIGEDNYKAYLCITEHNLGG